MMSEDKAQHVLEKRGLFVLFLEEEVIVVVQTLESRIEKIRYALVGGHNLHHVDIGLKQEDYDIQIEGVQSILQGINR